MRTRTLLTIAATAGMLQSIPALAADAARPAVTSYAAPTAATLGTGARMSAKTSRGKSLLTDTGSDIVLIAGAGAAGFFVCDIANCSNGHHHDSASPD